MLPLRICLVAASIAAVLACATTRSPRREERDTRVRSDSEWSTDGVTRVEELFVGRFPGVQVLQTPNGISVRIRGTTTVNGSAEPLYVVDGFPVVAGPEGLIDLNPRDIATIEVLKDAGSIAEYGMRGANGVVRITTKRARTP
jgi:TonB-dependent SusC/RagA subfamily outer membrane receptor